MATSIGFANVENLTEENYELLKLQMKSVLVFNELWAYVDGSLVKPERDNEDCIKKDSKTLALINLSITHGQLNQRRRLNHRRRHGILSSLCSNQQVQLKKLFYTNNCYKWRKGLIKVCCNM